MSVISVTELSGIFDINIQDTLQFSGLRFVSLGPFHCA